MASFFKDIGFGFRVLSRSPWISLWVILTLALGIGANSAIYSVVDAMLLHPVDYADPDHLLMLREREAQGTSYPASPANFLDWRAQAKSFSGIAGWSAAQFVMTGTDRPQQVSGAMVTANFFSTLGVPPALGRGFATGEDATDATAGPGSAAHVAMISNSLWHDAFGGSPAVLQKTIQLNGSSYSIVGVLPADFQFIQQRQVYIPVALDASERDYRSVQTVARLRASKETAVAEMANISASLNRQYPKSNQGWAIDAQNLLDVLVDRRFRLRLLMLLGAVGMVLLITCSNVAGLLLTRALSRSREMAVRVALGAPQGRLVRQLLTEYFLLALLGATAGLGVGAALIKIAPSIVPPNLLSTAVPIEPNPRVILFTLALSLLAGLLFGLAPALAGARQDVLGALRGGRSASSGTATQRVRRGLVVFQVAVALVLLATSALMSQSLSNMMRVDPGFVPQNTLATPMILPAARFDGPHAVSFQQDLMERVRSMPGVVDVTMGTDLPLYDVVKEIPFDREDTAPRSQAERPGVNYVAASPSYFHTLQIAKRAGREFSETDQESAPAVVLVNQAFVERYFPGQNPLGKRLILNRPVLGRKSFAADVRAEIVGVVNNVRLGPLTPEAQPTMYGPLAQNEWSERLWLTVRHAGNAGLVVPELRQAVSQMDSEQSIGQVTQLETRFSNQFSEHKFQMLLMACFAALATLLAIIGIYGVNSHSVTQRRGEIGLRMALGASPGAVMREVMGSGARLTGVGLALGIAGALAASAVLRTFLVGISATDPLTLGAAAALLLLISAIATYFPARRAMQVNPSSALRGE